MGRGQRYVTSDLYVRAYCTHPRPPYRNASACCFLPQGSTPVSKCYLHVEKCLAVRVGKGRCGGQRCVQGKSDRGERERERRVVETDGSREHRRGGRRAIPFDATPVNACWDAGPPRQASTWSGFHIAPGLQLASAGAASASDGLCILSRALPDLLPLLSETDAA